MNTKISHLLGQVLLTLSVTFSTADGYQKHKEWGPAWPNILDEGCSPLRASALPQHADASWIKSQVVFWYGDLYPYVVSKRWKHIKSLLVKKLGKRSSMALHLEDTSEAKVIERYGLEGTYRHWHDAYMLCDFLRHSKGQFNSQHAFPILMQDGVGANEVAITFSRLESSGKEYGILYPWPYHLYLAREGLIDNVPFSSKVPKVIFRGALSGPDRLVPDFHGRVKSSRLQLIYQWRNTSWADLGISYVPDNAKARVASDPEVALMLQHMTTPKLSISQMTSYKYVLVVEGADISSSFGWVLSSNCVPMHPYPFTFRVWFYNGLLPWIHFVPILPDGSDLNIAFEWCELNQLLCNQIGQTGRAHMRMMLDQGNLDAIKAEVVALWDLTF